MKLGIVGSGKIVQEFLPWLAQSPAVQVAALCSTERSAPQARALCEQYGVPLHTTEYRQLLASVDTVYIALPNLLHTAYARAALEAGRNVIVKSRWRPVPPRPSSSRPWPGKRACSSLRRSPPSIWKITANCGSFCPGWDRSSWCSAISGQYSAGTTPSAPARRPPSLIPSRRAGL